MAPIQIKITGHVKKSSQDICAEFLDTSRWSEFKGYGMLPGIKNASFETQTPNLIGSRIKVQNTDGSSHVEEIIEWDTARGIAMRFCDFSAPLSNLATHFIERWQFSESNGGTDIVRSMTMYPKGIAGQLMLIPISKMMKKALEQNSKEMA